MLMNDYEIKSHFIGRSGFGVSEKILESVNSLSYEEPVSYTHLTLPTSDLV